MMSADEGFGFQILFNFKEDTTFGVFILIVLNLV